MKGTNKKDKKSNPGPKLQATIVEAANLAKEIEAKTARLEELKSEIRTVAVDLMGDNNSFAIDTDLGKCHVVKVKDALTVAPGFDADVLKRIIPNDLWNLFFVMKPQLRSTAHDAFLSLSDEHRAQLSDPAPFVMQPRAAQVRLPK